MSCSSSWDRQSTDSNKQIITASGSEEGVSSGRRPESDKRINATAGASTSVAAGVSAVRAPSFVNQPGFPWIF